MSSNVAVLMPDEALMRGPVSGRLAIGLLVPMSGVMGVAGPSIINCALLAAEEYARFSGNGTDLILIDAGQAPMNVSRAVNNLVSGNLVHVLVGTHTSNVRVAVEQNLGNRVPYIFTPPHESDVSLVSNWGTMFLGQNPELQLRQPLSWLSQNRSVTRWALIGNDYVWPRKVHLAARKILRELDQMVVMDELVPINQVDAEYLVNSAKRAHADAILVSLVGRDGISFHRAIRDLGADNSFIRLCTALDENCLVAAGGDETGNLYSAMPTFMNQKDEKHQRLIELYVDRFGLSAPLPGTYAEGCYRGLHFAAALASSGLLKQKSNIDALRLLNKVTTQTWENPLFMVDAMDSLARMARAEGNELEVVGTFR